MFYKKAITRTPGNNFSEGITTAELGKPNFELAAQQHAAYIKCLSDIGVDVQNLNADLQFPDGCFVEDTAVIFPDAAIITNPGAKSRTEEIVSMREILEQYRPLFSIELPGTLEGGDVLRIDKQFYIGVSERTNSAGIQQFSKIVSAFGYTTTAIQLTSILHLKTGLSYIGNNTILGIKEMLEHKAFLQYQKIEITAGEEYACNCILIADNTLIIPSGFPKIGATLEDLNYKLIPLNMSEFEKMDGGLTCLSLLFS